MNDQPIGTAPAIAKASKGVTQAQALITGHKSHADGFEEGIVQYLADQGSTASAWRVDAAFGVFGSLPMLGVTFDDAFVLLDATEGNLDGPFDLDSPLDATALLSHHAAYSTGTTVKYVNASGCPTINAGTWHENTPLPASVPRPPCTLPPGQCRLPIWPAGRPPAPAGAYPPNLPAFIPSNPGWTGCSCAGGLCIEVDRGTITGAGIYLRIRYYNCNNVTLPISGCPSAAGCTLVREDWYTQ